MKKILVTGGPVHAHLDAVKIITNRFKGGLMVSLAEQFISDEIKVVYLCAKGYQTPGPYKAQLEVIHHNGFDDYLKKVLELAPEMDAVILGAAVANLLPLNPLKGKFPSHSYKPGDVIPIDFTIAPRVIDQVKDVMQKSAHLFGFKLLSGVPHEELVEAAYDVLVYSRATAVFANDAQDLQAVYAITKERAEHAMLRNNIVNFVKDCIKDVYYRTCHTDFQADVAKATEILKKTIKMYKDKFVRVGEHVFGTVAVRCEKGFVTTTRGKNEVEDFTYVWDVDHIHRIVNVSGKKATLNAPLIDWMFRHNPEAVKIVHLHKECLEDYPTYPYAPPGTRRDTQRECCTSFNIKDHGCMLMLDKDGYPL